jgi:hypothetical protein
MSRSFTLADSLAALDLRVYLERAARLEDGVVQLVGDTGVLAVYTAVLYPRGLLDRTPTVLGLRTFGTLDDARFDVVVPARALLDRMATIDAQTPPAEIPLPPETTRPPWTGISAPRGGWSVAEEISAEELTTTATTGIAEVAAAVPDGVGEHLVHRARGAVWNACLPGLEYVPRGVAFAALSLGFLVEPEEVATVLVSGRWRRLTVRRGHVLVKD